MAVGYRFTAVEPSPRSFVALGDAVAAVARLEGWVHDPSCPRYVEHTRRRRNDAPETLDVLRRHARWHGVLVLGTADVGAKAAFRIELAAADFPNGLQAPCSRPTLARWPARRPHHLRRPSEGAALSTGGLHRMSQQIPILTTCRQPFTTNDLWVQEVVAVIAAHASVWRQGCVADECEPSIR
jgi:hypothetical protein